MILVTRINKVEQFYVNEEMIEFIEESPETVITLSTKKKIVVMESAERILEMIRTERARLLQARLDLSALTAQ
jgi:flagellar protein FlbD